MHRGSDRIRSPSVVGSRLPLPLSHPPPRPSTNPPQLPTKLATWRRDFLLPTIRSQLHPYKIKSEAIRDRDMANARVNFNSRRGEIERIISLLVEFNTTREMEFGLMSDWTPPDDIDISFDPPEWYDDDSDHQQDFFDQDRIKAVTEHFDKQEAQLLERQLQLQTEQQSMNEKSKQLHIKESKLEERERNVDRLHDLQQKERQLLEIEKTQLGAQKIEQEQKEKELKSRDVENRNEMKVKEEEVLVQETWVQQKLTRVQQREEIVQRREEGVRAREDDVTLRYSEVKGYQGELDHREKELAQQAIASRAMTKQAEENTKHAEVRIKQADIRMEEAEQKCEEMNKYIKVLDLKEQKLGECSELLLEQSRMVVEKVNEMNKQQKGISEEKNRLEKQQGYVEHELASIRQQQVDLGISKDTWIRSTVRKEFSIQIEKGELQRKSDSLSRRETELGAKERAMERQLENVLEKNTWLDGELKKVHRLEQQMQGDKEKWEMEVRVREKEVKEKEVELEKMRKHVGSFLGAFQVGASKSSMAMTNEENFGTTNGANRFMEGSSNFSLNADSIYMVGQLKDLYSHLVQ
ncbi:hypothetical protein GGU10DRAFT_388624, partial [Lentinula aff. detonsa]